MQEKKSFVAYVKFNQKSAYPMGEECAYGILHQLLSSILNSLLRAGKVCSPPLNSSRSSATLMLYSYGVPNIVRRTAVTNRTKVTSPKVRRTPLESPLDTLSSEGGFTRDHFLPYRVENPSMAQIKKCGCHSC